MYFLWLLFVASPVVCKTSSKSDTLKNVLMRIDGGKNDDVMKANMATRLTELKGLAMQLEIDFAQRMLDKYLAEHLDRNAQMETHTQGASDFMAKSGDVQPFERSTEKRMFGFIGCNGWSPSCNNYGRPRQQSAATRAMTSQRVSESNAQTPRGDGDVRAVTSRTESNGRTRTSARDNDFPSFMTSGETRIFFSNYEQK